MNKRIFTIILVCLLSASLIAGSVFLPPRLAQANDSRLLNISHTVEADETLMFSKEKLNIVEKLVMLEFATVDGVIPIPNITDSEIETAKKEMTNEIERLIAIGVIPIDETLEKSKTIIYQDIKKVAYINSESDKAYLQVWSAEFYSNFGDGFVIMDEETNKILNLTISSTDLIGKQLFSFIDNRYPEWVSLWANYLELSVWSFDQKNDSTSPSITNSFDDYEGDYDNYKDNSSSDSAVSYLQEYSDVTLGTEDMKYAVNINIKVTMNSFAFGESAFEFLDKIKIN